MVKRMMIDAQHPEETRVVIADENQIYDFDFVSTGKKQLKGNIYLAKITRVEPSLQAAFVEYGGGKQGFLPFSEIHADYYQIPYSDRKRLMEEAASDDSDDSDTPQDHGSEQAPSDSADAPTPEHQPLSGSETAESESFMPLSEPFEGLPAAQEDAPHPAYLTQGAIDISTSEYVDMPDSGDDNIPMSQALSETESLHQSEEPGDSSSSDESASADAPAGEQSSAEGQTSEGVETLTSEEDEYRPKKNQFFKRYKIQEVIRRGQIVLIQVIKEERGNKGASLTTYLSLAGRYCVLMPNSPKDGGISRKIASADDRRRLKAISTELRLAANMSVIIRTAGMDRTRAEIKRDYDYLVKLWNQIREDTLKSNAPALIYEESDLIKRAIRDQYTSDIDELIIEGDEAYQGAREFMKLLLPSHTPKIKHYKEATPLFYAYNIEEQLLSMHDPVVKLKSGGYLVINPTEALISIDVNSGRATGERNIEETATKTNLEAAAEVARQLRLRDLAGLVVIDFIDMMESRNRRNVEKTLKDSLKADRAKIQLGRISPFGLLEMSRQRLRPSISESNMITCAHCTGRGFIRSNESMSIQMIRAIEKEASLGSWSGLRLIAAQDIALHLLNTKRDVLRAIEQRHNITIQVLIGADMVASEFNLEKMRRSQGGDRAEGDRPERERRPRRPERDRSERHERPERAERPERQERTRHVEASDEAGNDNIQHVHDESGNRTESPDDNNNERDRKRRRRGGRNRNRDRNDRGPRPERPVTAEGEQPVQENADMPQGEGVADDFTHQEGQPMDASGRPPRNRGGRGRRKWRDRNDRGPKEGQTGEPQENVPYLVTNDTDGNALPAFATEQPVMMEPVAARAEATGTHGGGESTAQSTDSPSKKGWWQKMIELDD